MTTQKAVLTPPEASEYCNIPVTTLAIYRSKGIGPRYFKPTNRRVLYRRADIDAWIEASIQQSTSENPKPAEGKRPIGRPRKDAVPLSTV